jgi:hypothetical protein
MLVMKIEVCLGRCERRCTIFSETYNTLLSGLLTAIRGSFKAIITQCHRLHLLLALSALYISLSSYTAFIASSSIANPPRSHLY